MIEVKNLKKSYGPIEAVSGISFDVERGEVVGFLGPNGAGKSTTMKILTGYINPTSGQATIAGHDVVDEPLEARGHIGYLPESTPLYYELNPEEYLRFIAEAHGVPARDRKRAIAQAAADCGITRVMHQTIGTLSKGYKQRVGLAQALLHRPDILILDEPTSGLDPNQILEIRELIRTVGQERTVLLSTHILPEVSATCSRVIIISSGSIVADDPIEVLENRRRIGEGLFVRLRAAHDQAESALQDLDGVETVTRIGSDGGDGLAAFRLGTTPGREIGEAVFALAVERKWSIAELRPERATLEDVFKELTDRDRVSA